MSCRKEPCLSSLKTKMMKMPTVTQGIQVGKNLRKRDLVSRITSTKLVSVTGVSVTGVSVTGVSVTGVSVTGGDLISLTVAKMYLFPVGMNPDVDTSFLPDREREEEERRLRQVSI